MKSVYADNNATTRVDPAVVEEMLPYFSDLYGNPSSMHYFGGQVEQKVVQAREQIAQLINCDPSEIIFTSCGTESDSTAIKGTLGSYPDKKHLVTSRVEHPAVLNLCRHLNKNGYELTELPVDKNGNINLDDVEAAITDETAVVSIMYANNETGVIFPIEEIGKIVKSKGAVFHCDAVQAVGKIPLDMTSSTIDLLAISGHKLHAPKGIGALYIRKGTKLTPFIMGGHQERGRRAGTENVPYIIGLGKAAEIARSYLDDENTRVKALRDRLEQEIIKLCSNTQINGDSENRLPNTTNISFEFVEGESILLMLSDKGIAASSGSACTSGSLEPSHVLRAMGIPFTFVHGSLRLSLSRYNNEEDVDYIIEHLPPIIKRLREISPFGKS
jgi:cysteine desulfurase